MAELTSEPMISADRLIPKVYESDQIYAECQGLKQELEESEHPRRAKELRLKLFRRQRDYFTVHLAELETLDLQAQVGEIAAEHGELGLHDAILANARARLAIGEANCAAIEGVLWKD
jgi:hypothetical protein